jgi:tripartite-type tricarboxylate transporter receptor subunit TctC
VIARRALLLTALAAPAIAQGFPDRPVRLVVPFPPGGGTDILARVMAQKLGEWLGQPMVVENRAGAGGAIGLIAVARARPDGHTLLFTSSPSIVVLPAMNPPPGYDPERDLHPIATLARQPMLFVVAASAPYRTLADLVAAGRQRELSFGSPGVGTDPHLVAEVLGRATGARFQHVPYRGGAPAIQAVLAGEIQFNAALTAVAKPLLADGRIRALAITSAERGADFPAVPTVAELGWPEVTMVPWWGLFAPAGLEDAAARRLNEAVARLSQDPEWLQRLQALAIDAAHLDTAQTRAEIASQLAGWRARLPGMALQ